MCCRVTEFVQHAFDCSGVLRRSASSIHFGNCFDERSVPIDVVAVGQVRMEELYRRPQLGEADKAIDTGRFISWLLCAAIRTLEKMRTSPTALRISLSRTFIFLAGLPAGSEAIHLDD